jgi:hypothetical protein
MKSSGYLLFILFIIFCLSPFIDEEQRESSLVEGGMSIKSRPWGDNVHIFPGGDKFCISVRGNAEWKNDDILVRIAPGEKATINVALKQESIPGWRGGKEFGAIKAFMAVSESGYESNVTLVSLLEARGMEMRLINARNLFNGTIGVDSVKGEFRGEILICPTGS